MANLKIVIGLSGGMDSTTQLAFYLSKGYEVHCIHFQYGSKHNPYELYAAQEIRSHYSWAEESGAILGRCELRTIDISAIYKGIDSSLLKSGSNIPEGHYEDEIMKATKVPGRNLIMIGIMAAVAEDIGAPAIGVGVHAGDHEIYPDCRESFIRLAEKTIYESSDKKVNTIDAPFIDLKKADILKIGFGLNNTPYELTRTCYKDQNVACGKCGSCQERLEAFEQIGKIDPIKYES